MVRMVKIVMNFGLLFCEGIGMLFVGVMFKNKKLMVSMKRENVMLMVFVSRSGCFLR